jgi:hypothetical protein
VIDPRTKRPREKATLRQSVELWKDGHRHLFVYPHGQGGLAISAIADRLCDPEVDIGPMDAAVLAYMVGRQEVGVQCQ